jgi:hypothetical protein
LIEHLFVLPFCPQAGVDTGFSTAAQLEIAVVGGGS